MLFLIALRSASVDQVAELVQERDLRDISEELQKVFPLASVQGTYHLSGSFRRGVAQVSYVHNAWSCGLCARFSAFKFPGDVSLEEYFVAEDAGGDLVGSGAFVLLAIIAVVE